MSKTALVISANGQDASFMCELLLSKGYVVHGIIRRSSNFNTQRIDHIFHKLHLHYGDVTDAGNIISIVQKVQPDEIYNFAAQSHVKVSCELENYTFQVNTMGLLNILQAVRTLGLTHKTKIYQSSTSEMFGNTTDGSTLLTEESLMNPVSPYGISKLAAHHIANYYRDAFGMFVVSSILLNHESERRGPTFVTQKIARYVADFQKNKRNSPLQLGNIHAKRDWGYAGDFVYGIYLMMQHDKPDNYLLATGEEHSVREFTELAFGHIGVDIEWRGSGDNERGYDKNTGELLVEVNPKYYRPIDIEHLVGDYSKAEQVLGWRPKVQFSALVKLMVQHHIEK
jgi:GDPmannose 4,6-dehydratase